MIKILSLTIVLAAGSLFAAEPLNTKDPISGDAVNPAIKTTYKKVLDLCCNKCKTQFTATPKAYMNAIKTARKGQCPLSNKAAKPGFSVTYSREVAFASAENKAKFEATPDIYIDKVR